MCRLLGVVSKGSVDYELFEEFADLAVKGLSPTGKPDHRGHRDGWGVACYRRGKLVVYERGEGSAREDPRFYEAAGRVWKGEGGPTIALAHVRRASKGAPKGVGFSHPFTEPKLGRTWSFQHNGELPRAHELFGKLDSLLYFERFLGGLTDRDAEGVARAAAAARRDLTAKFPEATSFTMMVSDGGALHALRDARRRERYYTLYADRLGDSVVVCSEPLLDMRADEEHHLPNGEFLTVEPDLTMLRRQLG